VYQAGCPCWCCCLGVATGHGGRRRMPHPTLLEFVCATTTLSCPTHLGIVCLCCCPTKATAITPGGHSHWTWGPLACASLHPGVCHHHLAPHPLALCAPAAAIPRPLPTRLGSVPAVHGGRRRVPHSTQECVCATTTLPPTPWVGNPAGVCVCHHHLVLPPTPWQCVPFCLGSTFTCNH